MAQAKVWTLKQNFSGFPKISDFELKEVKLPPPKDGGSAFIFTLYITLYIHFCRLLNYCRTTRFTGEPKQKITIDSLQC